MTEQTVAPGQVWRFVAGNRRVQVLVASPTRAIVLGLASGRKFALEVSTLRARYGLERRS